MTAAIFVDGGYAFRMVSRINKEARIDYLKLRKTVEKLSFDTVVDAYYLNSVDENSKATQRTFHNFLSKPLPRGAGFTVKLYGLKERPLYWPSRMGGEHEPVLHPVTGEQFVLKTQRAVDVSLAFYLIYSFVQHDWSKLYLLAGDSDYVEVVRHLMEVENVAITIIGAHNTVAQELKPYVTVAYIEDMWPSIVGA